MKRSKLINELTATGHNKTEARELADFAEELKLMRFTKLSSDTKKHIAEDIGINKVILVPRYVMASAASFAVFAVVFLAQTALPGSWLYPVKRGTEQVRTVVQPDFDEKQVEIRKDEVEQLKQEAAPLEKVEKAEEEYKKTQEKVDNKKREKSRNNDSEDENQSQEDGSRIRWGGRNRFRNNDNSVNSGSFEGWQR